MAMERIACDTCLVDLPQYYEANADIIKLNRQVMDAVLASAAGVKALVLGRLIVVSTLVRAALASPRSGSPLLLRCCHLATRCATFGQTHRNAVAAVLRTEMKGNRRVIHAVVLTDAAPTADAAAGPGMPQTAGVTPLRSVYVPTGAPAARVEEFATTDVVVLGKGRIKIELPRNADRPDARELTAIAQQLLQVAQESTATGTPGKALQQAARAWGSCLTGAVGGQSSAVACAAGLEAAHPIKDVKMNDLDIVEAYQGCQARQAQLDAGFHCTRCPDLVRHVRAPPSGRWSERASVC